MTTRFPLCGICNGVGYLDEDGTAWCPACEGSGDPWCDPETRWPIVVEERTIRVLWIDGESREDALRNARQDGDIYELFTPDTLLDAWWEVGDDIAQSVYATHRPDHERREGPLEKCACVTYLITTDLAGYGHARTCLRNPLREVAV